MDKDEDEKLSDQENFNAIINFIRVQDVHIMAATSYIAGRYPRDVTMECAYFSRELSQIHGSAQVTGQMSLRKHRQIYSTDISGRGWGLFGNHGRGHGRVYRRINGRGRGRNGRSNRDRGGMYDFNGIDISNPTRAFTDEEWTTLGPGRGRAHITQQP